MTTCIKITKDIMILMIITSIVITKYMNIRGMTPIKAASQCNLQAKFLLYPPMVSLDITRIGIVNDIILNTHKIHLQTFRITMLTSTTNHRISLLLVLKMINWTFRVWIVTTHRTFKIMVQEDSKVFQVNISLIDLIRTLRVKQWMVYIINVTSITIEFSDLHRAILISRNSTRMLIIQNRQMKAMMKTKSIN